MEIIDKKLLNGLTEAARDNTRLRLNYNFHKNLSDPVQRLLNALQPGTKMPVHRHRHTAETYIVLHGKLKLVLYADNKEMLSEKIISPENGVYGVNIEAGEWHTIEILEENTVIFEVKEGPYLPVNDADILSV